MLTRERLRRGRDAGFTLIELVVTVAILGVIAVVLLGVVIQYLKVSGTTQARLAESTDQQFISAYWQNDVSSLGRRTFTPTDPSNPAPTAQSVYVGTTGPSNCGATVGTVVVAFAWGEYPVNASVSTAWTPTAQEVTYVRVGSSAPYSLKRVRCKDGVEGAPLTVAHNLTGTPTITCDATCTAGSPPNRVSMEFTVRDPSEPASTGYTTTVSADRRQG
ncbi:type II secretion system protein [Nocardioides albidus]|uniref:Type II secretion system protein n=1 Tax=Nocardioides albidus TaxID=1517589 RepID=A0A5C4WPW8_9ACTN|nr:prepilin-type N-terminal cleavage/methylation domain-containing protein [Nocardioides albidus]TNM50221.1 type II secretion system protein [Nocardioides albidus]